MTKPGSTKETYHIVLDLKGADFSFKVGDSLGIYSENDPQFVETILGNLDPETRIEHPRSKEKMSLKTFLSQKVNLSRLQHPISSTEQLIQSFAPLLPRFYSIASSPLVHPDEAHLTVTVSTYYEQGQLRYGVASHFLSHLAPLGSKVLCYVQPAPHFTLPSDDSIPLIMVGPGTGIAPYRGFMQERAFRKASGKHWLFFGERHEDFDFYYQEFWETLVDQNQLKLDLAFSRDQEEKIYVQHRLYEKGAEIWSWLENQALFYVCGDADPMAKDVEATMVKIFQECGQLSLDDARKYLKELRVTKRYLTDVY